MFCYLDDHLDIHWAQHKVMKYFNGSCMFVFTNNGPVVNWVFLQAKFHPELDSEQIEQTEDSTEEEARRKALFAKSHEMIQKHNSDPKGKPQMAHNHISAMVFI